MGRAMRTLTTLTMAVALCLGAVMSTPAQAKEEVRLVYVEWSSAVATTNVAKAVLQEKMGYEVEDISVSAAAMYQSVATDSADALVCAWLPTTQQNYYEKTKDQLKDVGYNLKGTRIGMVVPKYVDIDTIGQMKDHAEKFENKIIGIDPGAGVMMKTDKAMDAYGLEDFQLMEGSGATMTAALQNAIRQDNWVAVTGWTPHWKFARWDLKYLKDPKNIYGGAEYIKTLVRQDLKEDMPKAYAFLDNFQWELENIHKVMEMNREKGTDPYENAVKWVNNHPEKVKAWLPDSH